MCFVPRDVQLRDTIVLAHQHSLTAGATSGANRKAAKVVKMHEQEGEDVEI